jgi:hypothetical protein
MYAFDDLRDGSSIEERTLQNVMAPKHAKTAYRGAHVPTSDTSPHNIATKTLGFGAMEKWPKQKR